MLDIVIILAISSSSLCNKILESKDNHLHEESTKVPAGSCHRSTTDSPRSLTTAHHEMTEIDSNGLEHAKAHPKVTVSVSSSRFQSVTDHQASKVVISTNSSVRSMNSTVASAISTVTSANPSVNSKNLKSTKSSKISTETTTKFAEWTEIYDDNDFDSDENRITSSKGHLVTQEAETERIRFEIPRVTATKLRILRLRNYLKRKGNIEDDVEVLEVTVKTEVKATTQAELRFHK